LREIFDKNLVIVQLIADRNYTQIITENKKFMIGKNLAWLLEILAEELPNLNMVTYRRGEAINFDFVKKQGDYYVFQGKFLDISRRKTNKINQIFNELSYSNCAQ
jgi:hypothetical protein